MKERERGRGRREGERERERGRGEERGRGRGEERGQPKIYSSNLAICSYSFSSRHTYVHTYLLEGKYWSMRSYFPVTSL